MRLLSDGLQVLNSPTSGREPRNDSSDWLKSASCSQAMRTGFARSMSSGFGRPMRSSTPGWRSRILGGSLPRATSQFPNLEAVFGEPISASDTTFAEFAAELDRDPDLLRRVYTQLNLPQPDDDDRLRADDLEFLREFLLVFDARDLGLGDDFLLRAARLCGDGVRRLVESVNSLMRGGATAGNDPGPRPDRSRCEGPDPSSR